MLNLSENRAFLPLNGLFLSLFLLFSFPVSAQEDQDYPLGEWGRKFVEAATTRHKSPDKALELMALPYRDENLEPYRLYLKANILNSQKRYIEAATQLELLLRQFPSFRYRGTAEERLYQAFLDGGQIDEIKQRIGKKRGGRDIYYLYRIEGEELSLLVQKALAMPSNDSWCQRFFSELFQKQRAAFNRFSESDRYNMGKVLFAGGKYDQGAIIFEEIYKKATGNMKGYTLYYMGRCAFARRQYTNARKWLKLKVDTYPDGDNSDSLFYLARACERLNKSAEAAKYYSSLVEKYPKIENAALAMLEQARELREKGEIWLAIGRYKKIIDGPYGRSSREKAHYETISCYHELSAWTRAIELHQQYRKSFPESSYIESSWYWEGICLKKLGRTNEAKAKISALAKAYPSSVFLIAASQQELIEDMPHPLRNIRHLTRRTLPLPSIRDPKMELGLVLFRGGLNAEAASELRAYAAKGKEEKEATAIMLYHEGQYSQSIALSFGLGGEYEGTLRYPQGFRDIVVEMGQKYDIDPRLIWSLIREESRFQPVVASRVGALGLMQLMPATAKDVAKDMGKRNFSVKQLDDPRINIEMGTHYLAGVLCRFGEEEPFMRVALALAGYNGGPGNANRWLKNARKQPIDGGLGDFIDAITFQETRNYLHKVLGSYLEYLDKDEKNIRFFEG